MIRSHGKLRSNGATVTAECESAGRGSQPRLPPAEPIDARSALAPRLREPIVGDLEDVAHRANRKERTVPESRRAQATLPSAESGSLPRRAPAASQPAGGRSAP